MIDSCALIQSRNCLQIWTEQGLVTSEWSKEGTWLHSIGGLQKSCSTFLTSKSLKIEPDKVWHNCVHNTLNRAIKKNALADGRKLVRERVDSSRKQRLRWHGCHHNLLENWVSKHSFFVLILTTAYFLFSFFGIKLFSFSR